MTDLNAIPECAVFIEGGKERALLLLKTVLAPQAMRNLFSTREVLEA